MPLVAPVESPRTLAESAFRRLQEAILNGELPPGARLRIEDLAAALDMSPMPVREALRRLDALGLIQHVPHRGARVAELSIDDLRDTYEARLALETLAIRRAATRFGDADAKAAASALAKFVRAHQHDDLAAARAAHTQFHFGLYSASGYNWVNRLIGSLWENSERYRIASLPGRGRLEDRQREHERILEACIAHDAQRAARELHNHLTLTANVVARKMGEADLFVPIEEASP